MSDIWTLIKWGAIGAGSLGVGSLAIRNLYRSALRVYDDVYERMRERRHDRLTIENLRTQNALRDLREIRPDERGRYPLLYGTNGILRDPNNLRAFTLRTVLERWPALESLDAIHRSFIAMQGVHAGNVGKAQTLAEPPSTAPSWPQQVILEDLIEQREPRASLHSVVLGVSFDEVGQQRVIAGDMTEMVHVLVSGASGFGKSTLLESMAKQLVLGNDCDVCAVDYGVNTFGALQDHLLYPIADTPELAVLLFQALIAELHRRRGLFAEHPRVKNLDQYNQTTSQGLRPLVCFVDESASLFQDNVTKRPATELAQMGRKYGLGLVFAGTDFKADTLPTEATGNCGARIALHLRPSLSRSLLDCRDASDLRDKGRALAELPGVPDLVEIQCPIVSRWDDLPPPRPVIHLQSPACPPGGKVEAEDGRDLDAIDDPNLPVEERCRRLYAAGASKRQIALRVFNYAAGHAFTQVSAALESSSSEGGDNSDSREASPDTTGDTTTTDAGPTQCSFCKRSSVNGSGVIDAAYCANCGTAVCNECSIDGLCPSCQG